MFFFGSVAEEPGDLFGHLDGSWWGWSFVVVVAFAAAAAVSWIVLFLFAVAVVHVGGVSFLLNFVSGGCWWWCCT